MNVILTYFATETAKATATDTECWKSGIKRGFHRHVSVPVSVSVAVTVTVSVKPCLYLPYMPLLLGRVRGNSAAGPGGRPPSLPRKRVGGAPGAYERQVRKNRTRSYVNGSTACRRTYGNGERYFFT